MTISKRGNFFAPNKSPWSFEKYDSDLERRMMRRLESDPHVVKWMKRHQLVIPWIDGQKHQRRYSPDFLVEYEDGRKAIVEVKDPSRIDSNDVQRKRKAAEIWCRQRGMTYDIATIG
ncbi:TnsA endonuclease N-terminal domain-containing protein [Mesorhizobium sp. STM 4661]|uniref:TnsA endonuclease N-terminal domain-containing protein n=1 Tax=Mesorhizobium sp. STM 4661 TaxID=1297570 RepID=UPI0006853792|nr:TnsA endonuclease N-terminal domain-containing protein [Mesorhizobium sp. STM 4661]